MKLKPKNSKTNDASEESKKHDLNLLTIYFLYRHHYLNLLQADICMYAGVSNLLQLKEIFDNHQEDLLLNIPGCTQKNLIVFRKQAFKISDPKSLDNLFENFYKSFERYKKIAERDQRIEELYQLKTLYRNDRDSRRKEILLDLEESEYGQRLKGNLRQFLTYEEVSKRLQNILLVNDFDSAIQILDLYLDNKADFLKFRNFGRKSFEELSALCNKYLAKVM
jgi:hypothetical protein